MCKFTKKSRFSKEKASFFAIFCEKVITFAPLFGKSGDFFIY